MLNIGFVLYIYNIPICLYCIYEKWEDATRYKKWNTEENSCVWIYFLSLCVYIEYLKRELCQVGENARVAGLVKEEDTASYQPTQLLKHVFIYNICIYRIYIVDMYTYNIQLVFIGHFNLMMLPFSLSLLDGSLPFSTQTFIYFLSVTSEYVLHCTREWSHFSHHFLLHQVETHRYQSHACKYRDSPWIFILFYFFSNFVYFYFIYFFLFSLLSIFVYIWKMIKVSVWKLT